MSDDETTVGRSQKAAVSYGFAKNAARQLVAFREEVGPFGTLLMTGLDWAGPERSCARRQAMQLLARKSCEVPAARAGASRGMKFCGRPSRTVVAEGDERHLNRFLSQSCCLQRTREFHKRGRAAIAIRLAGNLLASVIWGVVRNRRGRVDD